MKRLGNIFAVLVALAVALAMVGGCATATTDAKGTDPQLRSPSAEYVQEVERQALRRGYHVTWVNPPTDR